MKYQVQAEEIKKILNNAKNILIVLPQNASVDHLAAGLALYLSLDEASKNLPAIGQDAHIVCETPVLVNHANLFGVGQISNKLPQTSGGNLTITLANVAASDGTVPTLEKLDWYTKGTDLNLVFQVINGQRFEPTSIVPHYQGSGFNLIFTVGSPTPNDLGNLYMANRQVFEGVHIINLDNKPNNTSFGSTNIVDHASASLSEIVFQLLESLQLPINGDLATNILTGIFAATANLTAGNVSADTFQVVADALKVGGQKPNFFASSLGKPSAPGLQAVSFTSQETFTVPPVVGQPTQPNRPSAEERPMGEAAISIEEEVVSPEPDWLTPKVFKGGSIG